MFVHEHGKRLVVDLRRQHWRRRRMPATHESSALTAAGTQIPGALDRVISAGLTIEPRKAIFGSLRVRHFGPRPLIADGSVNSRSTTIWNGEVGYRLSNKARLVLEAFNIFDANVSDIDYFYTSRLLGEPVDGVEDIHTHPALPRSARIGRSRKQSTQTGATVATSACPIAKPWRIGGKMASFRSFSDEPVAEIVQCGEPHHFGDIGNTSFRRHG